MATLETFWEVFYWSALGIGAWTIGSSVYLYLRDRTGNSGRYKHWTED